MNFKTIQSFVGAISLIHEPTISAIWETFQIGVNMTNIYCGNPYETDYNHPCEFKQIDHHERFIRMRDNESSVGRINSVK